MKISQANRKFFMKWLPFNFCDRNCERCEQMRDDCKIYQDDRQFKLRCMMEGKDSNDMEIVFEHVGEIMAQTMQMIEKNLKEKGIEIDFEDTEEYDVQEKIKDKFTKKHPLYKKACKTSEGLHDLLQNFSVMLPGISCLINSVQREVEEISFYSPMIYVKTTRALHSIVEEGKEKYKFSRPDSIVSASIAYYSALTVKRSLENIKGIIGSGEIVWIMKINGLIKDIEEMNKIFEKEFAGIEKFRSKIIFNGRY